MCFLQRNLILKTFLKLLLLLVLFGCFQFPAYAQTAPNAGGTEGENGIASVGERLGLTSWKLFLFQIPTAIGSLATWVGGSMFDYSVSIFSSGMVGTIRSLGLGTAITEMWSIIRDVFNLLFIFGLILAGFKIIIGVDDAGSKRNIGTIIIAALLINFSLYVSQVIVDFSNIATHQIYQLMTVDSSSQTKTFRGTTIRPISSAFIELSGISKTNKTNQGTQMANELGILEVNSIQGAIILGILFCIFYLILGFVFAACAFVLLSRFFTLIFLMIFSPVMFLGFILPGFKSYTSDWWNRFLKQAFVGPALMFMIYLSLRALQGISTTSNDGGIMAVIIYLLLVVAFLWASLKVSLSLGGHGAALAMNTGKKWGNSVRGGATGWAGRKTLGRMGDAYNRRLEERGVSDKSWRRGIASKVAGSKYGGSYSRVDERGSNEKAAQKQARYEQLYGKRDQTKIGYGAASVTVPTSLKRKGGVDGALQAHLKNPTDPAAKEKARSEMERAVSGANNEQVIELLGAYENDSVKYDELVRNMSATQFEAALKAKPEDLNDKAQLKLKDTRTKVTEATLRDGAVKKADADAEAKGETSALKVDSAEALQKGIRDAKDYQLKALGVTALKANAQFLKQSQFDEIMKSKDYTPTEQETIKKARDKGLEELFDNDTTRAEMFKGMQDKDIASLPKKILLDDNGRSVQFITGGALKKIAEDDKLAEADRLELSANIRVRDGIDAKSTAIKYLKSPQGQEKYGEWPE